MELYATDMFFRGNTDKAKLYSRKSSFYNRLRVVMR